MVNPDISTDIVIIGAGVAGALPAYFLAKAGMNVVVLEAGPRITREDIFEAHRNSDKFDPVSIYPNAAHAPRPDPNTPDSYLINTGPFVYNPQYIRAVGGTTWHWSGGTSRFRPEDFLMGSTYGVGVDWPINYDDLEPYYARADIELGISGELSETDVQWRSTPYPMEPFPVPYLQRRVAEILKPHGFRFASRKQARNARDYDGRPQCRGNNLCIPICPIGAQYAAIHHVEKAEALGVRVLANSPVTKINAASDNKIQSVVCQKPDGSQQSVTGRFFVLAANGLESAKLLMMSADESRPSGLANTSELVGRNMMDHPAITTRIRLKEPVYPGRGPTNAGTFTNYSYGDFRSHRAASGLSIENKLRLHVITDELLRDGFTGQALDDAIRYRAARTIEFLSLAEQLPDPDRRVTLAWDQKDSAGLPRMKVHFDISEYTQRALDHMRAVHRIIAKHLDAEMVKTLPHLFTANHLDGTARMGNDPTDSVVDAMCRSHDHNNLFISGSAVFPTSGGNRGPTLTIAALAIRIADTILEQAQE